MKRPALRLKKAAIILFWIIIWQAASNILDNSIILVGPVKVLCALIGQVGLADFWKSIAFSFGKISLGFFLAFSAGILAGGAAWRFPLFGELLEPVILLMKSVPVASFVILALIWAGSRNLSILIAFLVVFPMIYIQTIAGLKSTDRKLLEMARVFGIAGFKKLFYIYRPALLPYLTSGCRMALGMSFKSGIAAEVIGVPDSSIGEKLYMAKIYLNTAELLAWTFVIIIISAFFERIFLWALSLLDPAQRQHPKQEDSYEA